MAKLIFTSRYLRDAPPAQMENYVRYIGTREGVEKMDSSKHYLPATIHQKQLIKQLLRDIPEAKEMRSMKITGESQPLEPLRSLSLVRWSGIWI